MSSKRGKLIVFEGLDRSGKSTQCQRLVDFLQQQGQKVEHTRFPNRITPIGQMISSYLSGQSQQEDHAIHLLFTANRWESAQAIENWIRAGTTVIIDRYYCSGCVYSTAKENPTLDLAWCRAPEVGLPRPDLCLFLDISSEAAATRGGYGNERYEKEEMQHRVRGLYAQLREHKDEGEDMTVVDASKSLDEVEQEIRTAVEATFRNVDEGAELRYVRPW